MSINLHVTLEIHAAHVQHFMAVMEEIVPVVEGIGWKLTGAFVQRTGRLHNVIDLWELRDFNHFDVGIQTIASHKKGPEFLARLAECVISETVVFAEKAPYAH